MPEVDWRTDNWAGRPDINRQKHQWSFPNSTKEIGWGWYRTFNDDYTYEPLEKHYSVWTILTWLVALLFLAAIIPEVRVVFEIVGKIIEAWFSSFDVLAAEITNGTR
jgi:hypothetical protein